MSRLRANQITNENANGAPNFPHGLTVTGIITATTGGQNISGDLTVSGNTTLTGSLGVGGTITYEDVTNIDSVGIITARSGVKVTSGDIAMDTAGNITLGDSGSSSDDRIVLGASSDLSIYHDGSHSRIDETGTGNLMIQSDNAVFIKKGTSENIAVFNADGAVDLYLSLIHI